jgi:general secretion pathway protein D
VVEFDSNELERLGMSLQQYQSGRVSNLSTQLGVPGAQNSLSFVYNSGANAPLMYTAMIDVLSAQDKARVIARPYTAAMSGRKAVVQIARSRDVQQRLQASVSGGTVSLPPPVTRETGVKLDVTPWVQADGRIRVELNVEESVFIDDLATNVISEIDKSTAATTMMVASGESIIIGGLTVRRKSSSNAGLPWLRNVPVLNFFTAQRESAEQKQDVIIYITPYIIGAGVELPFPLPDAFKFRDGQDDLTEVETFKKAK